MKLQSPKLGSGIGRRLAKMAARTLRASQIVQIQNRRPRGSFRSAGPTSDPASRVRRIAALLTADPRVDNVYREVEDKVDEDDADGDLENDVLDEDVVAGG